MYWRFIFRSTEESIQWSPRANAPIGAFIVATFDEDETGVNERWKSLVGVLAGLFCISLNQLNLETSISPQFWVKICSDNKDKN